ncbi:hypothetical protein [Miltoncostaea oceani]|uniref:hypothetical protein n=1 Tax=Miltoncostaea oceani TaxID=2843216 RepID=UPI001C3D8BCF|nr:hypothetical protein [Miltoncostaea oceani]
MLRRRAHRAGYTLVEIIIAGLVGVILLLIIGTLLSSGLRSHISVVESNRQAGERRSAISVVTTKLSQAELPLRQAFSNRVEWRLDEGDGKLFHLIWADCLGSDGPVLRYSKRAAPFSGAFPPSTLSSDPGEGISLARLRSCAAADFSVVYRDAAGAEVAPAPAPPSGSPTSTTFGVSSQGTSGWFSPGNESISASAFVSPVSGSLTQISVYLDGFGPAASGSQNARAVLYNAGASGDAKIAESSTVNIVKNRAAGWVTFAFPSPVDITNRNYYLALQTAGPNQIIRHAYATVTNSASRGLDSFTDGAAANLAATSTDNRQLSIRGHVSVPPAPAAPPAEEAVAVSPRLRLARTITITYQPPKGPPAVLSTGIGLDGILIAPTEIPEGDFDLPAPGPTFETWVASPANGLTTTESGSGSAARLVPASGAQTVVLDSRFFTAQGDNLQVEVRPESAQSNCQVSLLNPVGDAVYRQAPSLPVAEWSVLTVPMATLTGQTLRLRLTAQGEACQFDNVVSLG